MVSYAIACGIPAMAAVTIYSVEGLAGLGGRLLLGVLADRIGVKLVLIAGLRCRLSSWARYLFVNQLGEFYALAVSSAPPMAASCRSTPCWRANISASA